MKDKTHEMNRGYSVEEAEDGFQKAGMPERTSAAHKRRMQQGNLTGNEALEKYENAHGDGGGDTEFGGFLKRTNYDERF